MSFNPDLMKQAQEAIFSRKKVKGCHPSVFFNETIVGQVSVVEQVDKSEALVVYF